MIQLTPHMRLLVCVEPIDFRGGIDGLARLCRAQLREDPMAGTVFVFRNRRGTGLKLLCYDGSGFWLCYKRFSSNGVRWWPRDVQAACRLRPLELSVVLSGGDPSGLNVAPDWRPLLPG